MLDLLKYKKGIPLVSGLEMRGLRTVVTLVALLQEKLSSFIVSHSHTNEHFFPGLRDDLFRKAK